MATSLIMLQSVMQTCNDVVARQQVGFRGQHDGHIYISPALQAGVVHVDRSRQ